MKYVCFKFLSFNEYPQTAYVGAYRIHPNAHTYLRGCFQGVCNTPFVTPDLQSGVIETRICNPHRPHGAFLQMLHQWILRITNPQLGYAGLQIQHNNFWQFNFD